uniref:Uncharacterized protein n=1 Tax=viral metagenome TaxID=1070528 RepID=A0A6C0E4X4_9ZZZZ
MCKFNIHTKIKITTIYNSYFYYYKNKNGILQYR